MGVQLLLKPANKWAIALSITVAIITGATLLYKSFQPKQQSELIETVPPARQITALGRLEPVSEVIGVSHHSAWHLPVIRFE